MEQLLWTFDDVVRFVNHPDRPLRQWALERLTMLFPHQAGGALVPLLDDPNFIIFSRTVDFLSGADDAERYGPLLLDRLRQAQGYRFGYLAEALAHLDVRDALPLILERLARAGHDQSALDANEFLRLVHALGQFGGDEARQALWGIIHSFSQDAERPYWAAGVMDALLDAAQPVDVVRLVQVYRTWSPEPRGYGSQPLEAFAAPVGATRLVQEIGHEMQNVDAALERAAWWLGRQPALSDDCLDDLAAAFDHQHEGVFDVLLHEAGRLVAERGDPSARADHTDCAGGFRAGDVAGWQAAWEAGAHPVGYRREAIYTLLVLEAFAAHPSPHLEQRQDESGLGLALLCQLSVNRDDQARLEAAADPTETLLTILAENREYVLPDVVERVVALGPAVVPPLVSLLAAEEFSWGTIRVAQAIEGLTRRHPGSCDAAIPALIDQIYRDQSDFLLETCSEALRAMGPAAVGPAAAHLRDDETCEIYLASVLGEIPTEGAAQAILGLLGEDDYFEELQIYALADIGSPAAIEPLYAIWQDEGYPDHLLAGPLLVLCELNGVQKPELPEWRRIVEAEDQRMDRIFSGSGLFGSGALEDLEPPRRQSALRRVPRAEESGSEKDEQAERIRPVHKPKGPSKQERKKREAQKKAQRKGKKKRKR